MPKTWITGALLLGALATAAFAETNEEKFEKKLKEPFASNAAWITDYEQALTQAAESKKPIFAYFTRSYSP